MLSGDTTNTHFIVFD